MFYDLNMNVITQLKIPLLSLLVGNRCLAWDLHTVSPCPHLILVLPAEQYEWQIESEYTSGSRKKVEKGKTYPSNKTLLSLRHRVIYWLSSCQKFEKNYAKTINVTLLSNLSCHSIPKKRNQRKEVERV